MAVAKASVETKTHRQPTSGDKGWPKEAFHLGVLSGRPNMSVHQERPRTTQVAFRQSCSARQHGGLIA